MTSEPFRLRFMIALTGALEEIDSSDGYVNDMDGKVFRGRRLYGSGDPLPMLSLIEDTKLFERLNGPDGLAVGVGDWRVIVQGFVEDDPQNPSDPAYRLASDTVRRLAEIRQAHAEAQRTQNGVSMLGIGSKAEGNMVTDMTIGSPVLLLADEVSDKAGFGLPIVFKTVENLTNPLA